MSRTATVVLRDKKNPERATEPIEVVLDERKCPIDLEVLIDGAYHGDLRIEPIYRLERGWEVSLGQVDYDDEYQTWRPGTRLRRQGGWVERNDAGHYPMIDGRAAFTDQRDDTPVTFETVEQAHAALTAAMLSTGRETVGIDELDVVDVRIPSSDNGKNPPEDPA